MTMKDITGAQIVEITVRDDARVLWINVDGKCALRICHITGPVTFQQQGVHAEPVLFLPRHWDGTLEPNEAPLKRS